MTIRKALFTAVIIITSILVLMTRFKSIRLLSKPLLKIGDYDTFSADFKLLVITIGLSLFFSVLHLSAPAPDGTGKAGPGGRQIPVWVAGFALLIGVSIFVVVYANPEGRYPFNKRDNYVTLAARSLKTKLYRNLKATPDVVIYGSSASFAIPADVFKDKWGFEAFNMALNGGGPVDFVTMTNFILQHSPDHKVPAVMTVELLASGLWVSNPTQTPLELLPYMAWDEAIPALFANLDQTIRLTPVSDSIFTLVFLDHDRWNIRVKFTEDGTGIRAREVLSASEYEKNVQRNVGLARSFVSCKELDASGTKYIQKLVDLGKEHKFSLVFYLHPINADFFAQAHVQPSAFASCKNNLLRFMDTLTRQNQNVFFVDLSQYEPITTGGRDVYTDTHHLTNHGSTLLLQALEDPIRSAMEWTIENRR